MNSGKFLLCYTFLFIFHWSFSSAETPCNTSFISKSCNSTRYPEVCCDTLFPYASSIQRSHKFLLRTSLNVTLLKANSILISVNMNVERGRVGRQDFGASKDCIELLQNSIYELQISIDRLEGEEQDFPLLINDISTWVSAALTDQTTCTDGLTTMASDNTSAGDIIGKVDYLSKMTSNSLALIVQYATIHG